MHKNIVSVEFQAKTNYEHNLRPFIVTRNIDFAENGSFKNKKEVQSQYWVTISYTLFVSIVMWLSADEWNKEEGELKIDDEVTAFGEKAGKEINMDSFWGCVTKVLNTGMYEVTDASNNKHILHRQELRHQKSDYCIWSHIGRQIACSSCHATLH